MQIDRHHEIRHIIDRSLVGEASSQEEQALREHLLTCAPCQEYLNASHRAIAGLAGFSFEVNPDLHSEGARGRHPTRTTTRNQQGRAKADAVELPGCCARAHSGRFVRRGTI